MLANVLTMNILSLVLDFKKYGSYQEIAYAVSKGNKGYVYLICIMKLFFLTFTAALCLMYLPNAITCLFQMARV